MELKRDEFEAWLRTLPADEPMAERGKCHHCPIAKWFHAKGRREVAVHRNFLSSTDEKGVIHDDRLPAWVEEFVNAVDRGYFSGDPVTAAECLAILEGIPR